MRTNSIGLYAKAVFATIMAGVTSVYAALDGDDFNLTDKDWVAVAIAALTALGVYLVPNAKNSEV